MSMCSLTDFIETSLGRCGGWVSTATVTGQGASLVDASVRGGDFSWPPAGTSAGHNRGLFHGHGHSWNPLRMLEAYLSATSRARGPLGEGELRAFLPWAAPDDAARSLKAAPP